MNSKIKEIGLALSGGGQRAAAFHLGVLNKLQELHILENVKTISAISGGAIIAAYYLLYKENFGKFYSDFREKLKVNLEWRILFARDFIWKLGLMIALLIGLIYCFITLHNLIFLLLLIPLAIAIKYLLVIFPTGNSLQKVYDKVFYEKQLLIDLPDTPKVFFNSTNLQTGTLMTFSKKEINDSTYIYKYEHVPKFYIEKIPVSFAVTASTSFAPLISPLKFHKNQIIDPEILVINNIKPELVDGGIYDNQGIYRLIKNNIDIIICSDASSPYDRDKYTAINPFCLLMRTINILMKRIRAFQYVDAIFENANIYEIGYFSIDWQYKICLDNFVALLFQNKIKQNVLDCHMIPNNLLTFIDENDKKMKTSEIIIYLKQKIGFEAIVKDSLTDENVKEIATLSTRLCGLTESQIRRLIKHGETLTAIQIKLYCPSLKIEEVTS